MKIKAAVVYNPGDPYIIEEVDLADPKESEVLVKITASGVCHTDYLLASGGMTRIHPVVLGHEGSGVVERVGDTVTDFAPGDRVAMSFSYCGVCHACRTGRNYECADNFRLNFGGRSYDGSTRLTKNGAELSNFFNQASFATYSVTHRNNLVRVPDDMDLKLTGPLGCGIQTGAGSVLNALKPEPGSSLVVVGCGGVGMSALMAAKICGCYPIIAVDTVDSRLELAAELGATHTVNAARSDTVAAVMDLTGGGANYSVNASGSGATARAALECLDNFGSLAVIGGGGECTYDFIGSRTIMGITEGRSLPWVFIPQLISYHKRGLFPFDRLIRYYSFEDINAAMSDSLTGRTIKPVLVMDE